MKTKVLNIEDSLKKANERKLASLSKLNTFHRSMSNIKPIIVQLTPTTQKQVSNPISVAPPTDGIPQPIRKEINRLDGEIKRIRQESVDDDNFYSGITSIKPDRPLEPVEMKPPFTPYIKRDADGNPTIMAFLDGIVYAGKYAEANWPGDEGTWEIDVSEDYGDGIVAIYMGISVDPYTGTFIDGGDFPSLSAVYFPSSDQTNTLYGDENTFTHPVWEYGWNGKSAPKSSYHHGLNSTEGKVNILLAELWTSGGVITRWRRRWPYDMYIPVTSVRKRIDTPNQAVDDAFYEFSASLENTMLTYQYDDGGGSDPNGISPIRVESDNIPPYAENESVGGQGDQEYIPRP